MFLLLHFYFLLHSWELEICFLYNPTIVLIIEITSAVKVIEITSVFKSSISEQCIQIHINLPVNSKVYKIPVYSKELHRLQVVQGMAYEIMSTNV